MAAKKHIVKINEEQYSYLKGSDDTKHFDGNNSISASGKMNRDEDGESVPTDYVTKMFTPQAYTYYRTPQRGKISEGQNTIDGNFKNVDDDYEIPQANTMSNGNQNDDNTVVPQLIVTKLNQFIQAVSAQKLNYVQKANIVNKFLESMDFSDMPYRFKKEIRLKIN